MGEWLYYNFAAGSFHTKKLCSRLYSTEVDLFQKMQKSFLATLWGLMGNVHTPPIAHWKASGRFHLRMPKCLVFFCNQYNTDNTDFGQLILCRFWPLLKLKTWTSVCMRTTVKNFRFSAQGILQVPKQLKMGTFEGCLWYGYSSNGTTSANGVPNVLGTSRHPKDVCFVSGFWWGTYGLGAISPRKNKYRQNLIFWIYKITNFNITLYCVPRYVLCYWLQEPEAGALLNESTVQCHPLSLSLYYCDSTGTLQPIVIIIPNMWHEALSGIPWHHATTAAVSLLAAATQATRWQASMPQVIWLVVTEVQNASFWLVTEHRH